MRYQHDRRNFIFGFAALAAVSWLSATIGSAPASAANFIYGEQLRTIVSGGLFSTMSGKGFPLKLEFRTDGRLSGQHKTPIRIVNDNGRWWMSPIGALCFQFERFGRGKKRCRLFKLEGDKIALFKPNGDPLPHSWTVDRFGTGAATVLSRIRQKSASVAPPAFAAAKDSQAPSITAPSSLHTDTAIVAIAGRVSDDSLIVEVTVNQRPIPVSADGSFNVRRGVPQGKSTLTIAAIDEWGNRATKTVGITRRAPPVHQAKLDAGEPKSAEARAEPAADPFAGIHFGGYHALVIGNNDYWTIEDLRTAENDARAVAEVLQHDYGFRVTLLTNATRADVIGELANLRATLMPDDNLLIYFAGHGVLDHVAGQGYWLPVDAEEDNPTNWISTNDITTMIRVIRAKHIMVVADSCYSGTLVRAVSPRVKTARAQTEWIKRMVAKRARTALVSGGLEPVEDGSGAHSVFARAFIDALYRNRGVLAGAALYDAIKRPVVLNTDQTPQYSDIRRTGHDGGDFLFVRRKFRRTRK